jgi:hypothetical protein
LPDQADKAVDFRLGSAFGDGQQPAVIQSGHDPGQRQAADEPGLVERPVQRRDVAAEANGEFLEERPVKRRGKAGQFEQAPVKIVRFARAELAARVPGRTDRARPW